MMNDPKTKPPFDVLEILVGGASVIATGALVLTVILFVVGETVEHFTIDPAAPTADQVYGCTIKKQLPNGDCP